MSDDFVEEPVVEEPAEAEAPIAEAHDEAVDPWERVRAELTDVDPDLVIKNVKQYTQTHQQLAEERKALEPLREIQRAFQDDPAFADYVVKYQEKREGEMGAEELAREALRRVEAQEANFTTQKVLSDLHRQVVEEYGESADFDDIELLEFATRNRIADPEAAYLKLKKADLLSGVQKRVIEKEKEKKSAGVETRVRQTAAKSSYTRDDIAAMSDEDFWANFEKMNQK